MRRINSYCPFCEIREAIKCSDKIKTEMIQAYVSGYERGHDDTVESCYGNYEEKAIEFVEELGY